MRWVSLAAGTALVALSFAAITRVTDTREGMVAEVVTLLGFVAGTALLIYGLTARRTVTGPAKPTSAQRATSDQARPRTRRDLLLGAGGIVLALVLVAGLAISGGPLWAGFGLALLLPMISGSIYLCVRFLRASP